MNIEAVIAEFLKTHSNWDELHYVYKPNGLWKDDDGNPCGCHQLWGSYTKDNIHTLNFERYCGSIQECIDEIKSL